MTSPPHPSPIRYLASSIMLSPASSSWTDIGSPLPQGGRSNFGMASTLQQAPSAASLQSYFSSSLDPYFCSRAGSPFTIAASCLGWLQPATCLSRGCHFQRNCIELDSCGPASSSAFLVGFRCFQQRTRFCSGRHVARAVFSPMDSVEM